MRTLFVQFEYPINDKFVTVNASAYDANYYEAPGLNIFINNDTYNVQLDRLTMQEIEDEAIVKLSEFKELNDLEVNFG